MKKKDCFTVSDGDLVLHLECAEEGGYVVTSPFEPELVTEADTLEEVFAMARDAVKALRASRAKLHRRLARGDLNSTSSRTQMPSSFSRCRK